MKRMAELFYVVLLIIPWLSGIVLAKGFWSTAVAVMLPPYAWYLVVERAMAGMGCYQ